MNPIELIVQKIRARGGCETSDPAHHQSEAVAGSSSANSTPSSLGLAHHRSGPDKSDAASPERNDQQLASDSAKEWDSNPALQAEFRQRSHYVAFRKAEAHRCFKVFRRTVSK